MSYSRLGTWCLSIGTEGRMRRYQSKRTTYDRQAEVTGQQAQYMLHRCPLQDALPAVNRHA